MAEVTVVVPAYNEAPRIGRVVRELVAEYDVLVIGDGSTDRTVAEAREAGATVIEQPGNGGYVAALKRGFRAASGDVVATYDGDGEHRPADIERLVEPVREDRSDLVLGTRTSVPRRSERLLNALVRLNVDVADSYTGFRAMRRSLATDLELDASSNCGTLVLEAARKGARIGEIEVETRRVRKPRGIAWEHGRHFVDVLRALSWGGVSTRSGPSAVTACATAANDRRHRREPAVSRRRSEREHPGRAPRVRQKGRGGL